MFQKWLHTIEFHRVPLRNNARTLRLMEKKKKSKKFVEKFEGLTMFADSEDDDVESREMT